MSKDNIGDEGKKKEPMTLESCDCGNKLDQVRMQHRVGQLEMCVVVAVTKDGKVECFSHASNPMLLMAAAQTILEMAKEDTTQRLLSQITRPHKPSDDDFNGLTTP